MSRIRITLLDPPIGNGNLGDEATVAAAIQSIRRREPDADICVITPNPDDTRNRHGVDVFPIRWVPARSPAPAAAAVIGTGPNLAHEGWLPKAKSALKWRSPLLFSIAKRVRPLPGKIVELLHDVGFLVPSWRLLSEADLLILPGSGCLCDHFGGVLNFPLTIFVWCLLARLNGATVAFASVGAGPLNSKVSRLLVKASLGLAAYRSVRDETTRKIVSDLSHVDAPIYPDLAHGLVTSPRPPMTIRRDHLLVGINPFPHLDPRYWPDSDAAAFERYLGSLAAFACRLIASKHRVLLFPTQVRADSWVIHDLKNLVISQGADSGFLVDCPVRSVDDLVAALATTDIVVAGRFHGILLAFLMSRPVIGIWNHHKMRDLMSLMGQSAYALDANSITSDLLAERFDCLVDQQEVVIREINAREAEFRQALDTQYDKLLTLASRHDRQESPRGWPG